MSSMFDRPRPTNVIDLTLSDDETPPPVPATRPAHISRPPISQSATPPKTNHTSQTSYLAEIPSPHTNDGLLSNGFYSRGPLPHVGSPVSPWLHAPIIQNTQHVDGGFIRRSGENPAKRIRVGERPMNLSKRFPVSQSAMPEVPINVLDRAVLDTRRPAQDTGYSAHNALNIVNEAAFPRKSTKQKGPSNSTQNRKRLCTTEAPRRDTTSVRTSSSDVEILEWRRKESPHYKIIANTQKLQIFPFVRTFLRELGEGLPEGEIRQVGKAVVDKICDNATVRLILTNKGLIPLDYQMQLANRARTMIKLELNNFRNRRTSAAVLGFQVGNAYNHIPNEPSHNPTLHAPISGPAQRSSILSGETSSSSSEVDAVFDQPFETDRPTPTTSPELSADSEKPKGRDTDSVFSVRANDSTTLLRRRQLTPRISLVSGNNASRDDVDVESSEWSEESPTSDDEDITADVKAYLKTLKTPSAPGSPIKPNFGDTLPPAVVRQNLAKEKSLEREERRYRFFGLDPRSNRPYLNAQSRADLRRGLEVANTRRSKVYLSNDEKQALRGSVFHVDFADEEMAYMADVITMVLGMKIPAESRKQKTLRNEISRMMAGRAKDISKIVNVISFDGDRPNLPLALRLIKRRGKSAVTAFLEDAVSGSISSTAMLTGCSARRKQAILHTSEATINSLLRQRESLGKFRSFGAQREVKVELSNFVEDTIVPYRQWMDCSGDVIALAWNTKGTSFVCGATAHSDSHNQQYNKPGNLIFGSINSEVMRARPDHKIPRPVVVKGDNSFEAMRETQDPWLYSSVVCAAYSPFDKVFFTSSFDKTVKVWGKGLDETQPELRGTWKHEGNVNFVVTSENHGLVATACDIVRDAIRVYEVKDEDMAGSSYITYSGLKANEQVAGDDKTWAYFPATIAWAKCPLVEYLLLVGYSPRSTGIDESDIPEEKRNVGELCLWDTSTDERIDIWPRSQNVFEVVWHPTQPVFFAATAPHGTCEPWVRTQIRVFALNEKGGFTQTKALDCCAVDINEITVMPNSGVSSYVTASCTDGKVYVWDTALGDDPIHVLEHGASIDDRHYIDLPNELSDNGVKFAAWGATIGRFYTGSSDGFVKAWDVRALPDQAFIRDVARLSGGVSSGAFSPDLTHLLIGDATGKVHLLHIKDTEAAEESSKVFPKMITPHPQPDEDSKWAGRGGEIGSALIRNGIIVLSENKEVGAVQGPAYPALGWHCPLAHEDGDPRNPLVPEFASKQQYNRIEAGEFQDKRQSPLQILPTVRESILARFAKEKGRDLELTKLDKDTLSKLLTEDWVYEDEHDFEDVEDLVVGGRLVKKLRKGEDWEEDWEYLDL